MESNSTIYSIHQNGNSSFIAQSPFTHPKISLNMFPRFNVVDHRKSSDQVNMLQDLEEEAFSLVEVKDSSKWGSDNRSNNIYIEIDFLEKETHEEVKEGATTSSGDQITLDSMKDIPVESPEEDAVGIFIRRMSITKKFQEIVRQLISEEEAKKIFLKIELALREKRIRESKRRNWKSEELRLLFYSIYYYMKKKAVKDTILVAADWDLMSGSVPGRSSEQCFYKWKEMTRKKSTNETWRAHETVLLEKVVTKDPWLQWQKIAKDLKPLGVVKTAKQCRERWLTVAKPDILRSPWSLEEDAMIVNIVKRIGKKWAIAGKKLPGRIPSHIKYRLNTLLKDEKKVYIQEVQNLFNGLPSAGVSEEIAGPDMNQSKSSSELENILILRLSHKLKHFLPKSKIGTSDTKSTTSDPKNAPCKKSNQ